MPKAILEFTLPEEDQDFSEAINGGKYKAILQEIDNYLRNQLKHGEHPEDFQDACEKIRGLLHRELQENNLLLF